MRCLIIACAVVGFVVPGSRAVAVTPPKKAPAAEELAEGWIICLGARPKGDAAQKMADELAKKGVPNPKILWMGDYQSFGKKDFWLIYHGPIPRADKAGAKAQLKKLKALVPDAYGLLMSLTEKRTVLK